MEDNNSLEIQDTENFRGGGEVVFSHQSLVMKAMNRVVEISTHEMHNGINVIETTRDGLTKQNYRESSREAFCEAVETCEMVMSCDLDELCEKEINEIRSNLDKRKNELLKEQTKYWRGLPQIVKMDNNLILISDVAFDSRLPFYSVYQKEKISAYRKIFASLTRLTKRLDFFAGEDFEA